VPCHTLQQAALVFKILELETGNAAAMQWKTDIRRFSPHNRAGYFLGSNDSPILRFRKLVGLPSLPNENFVDVVDSSHLNW